MVTLSNKLIEELKKDYSYIETFMKEFNITILNKNGETIICDGNRELFSDIVKLQETINKL